GASAPSIIAPLSTSSVEWLMFENLTDRLSQTLRHVTGKAKLTEDNIKDTLREVRMALL
ncbi:MAG TPA: signal recognition particle protein, partial [Pseudomonas sp.]|nr:signal recognition particle protein [Pseudomonas sp.]